MAKLLDIVTNPSPELRKISKEYNVSKINSKETKTLVEDMKRTMVEKDGIGLAGPQVGKKIRLIVVNTEDGPMAMFNPIITRRSWAKAWDEEGCLSVPGTFGKVQRHKRIHCVFVNENGITKKIQASDLFARVVQHEIDHLDGILFIDKAKDIKKISND